MATKKSFPLQVFENEMVHVVYLSRETGRIKIASSNTLLDTSFRDIPKVDDEPSVGASLRITFMSPSFETSDVLRIFGITSDLKSAIDMKNKVVEQMIENLRQDLKASTEPETKSLG